MTNLMKTLALSTTLALGLSACATYDNNKMDDDAMMDKGEMSESMDKDMMDDKMMSENPMVGGAAMMASKTIVENASAAPNLTTLVAAVKQAQLVETLSSPGPFTVFAPTNDAFAALPGDTVSTLLMDENRADLQKVLTAHVVPGTITAADLIAKIKTGGGSYAAETASGDTLTFYVMNGEVKVSDENNNLGTVTTADVMQSNGVVHVVNSVLVPK